jgi:hypothetical protein
VIHVWPIIRVKDVGCRIVGRRLRVGPTDDARVVAVGELVLIEERDLIGRRIVGPGAGRVGRFLAGVEECLVEAVAGIRGDVNGKRQLREETIQVVWVFPSMPGGDGL